MSQDIVIALLSMTHQVTGGKTGMPGRDFTVQTEVTKGSCFLLFSGMVIFFLWRVTGPFGK